MARLNAWFSSASASKAATGDYSGIISELPAVVFDTSDKGTILRTTLAQDGVGGHSLRGKTGQQILDYNDAKIVGFYLSAGYNGGNRLWLTKKNGETFHIDQYRTEKSNVTKDIAAGVAVVASAGAASYLASAGSAVGALGASETTAAVLPVTGVAPVGAGSGITLGGVGSALSAVGTVAKGIGQAAGAIGTVAGAIGAVQAINGQTNKPNVSQISPDRGSQLTGGGLGGILNSVSPYLLFGGLIISIALFARGK